LLRATILARDPPVREYDFFRFEQNGFAAQRRRDAQQSRHIVTCQIELRDKIKPSGR